jgi:hypothetical protein
MLDRPHPVQCCRANDDFRALAQSLGIMASYRYLPSNMHKRSEAYAAQGSISIHTSLWALVHHPAFVH